MIGENKGSFYKVPGAENESLDKNDSFYKYLLHCISLLCGVVNAALIAT